MRRTVVFSGPTLRHRDITAAIPDAICLPPAAQGSVVAAVLQFAPQVILLIDGVFQSEPAVRHNEILWAISRGVHVVGAASMGALRAAELHPYMTGYGLIYRWYRRCPLAPDDAVAVLHGPAELDYLPLTESGIDLRMTFRRARRCGLLCHEDSQLLQAAMQRLNFRDRTLDACIDPAGGAFSGADRSRLLASLRNLRVPQKQADALGALEALASGHLRRSDLPVNFEPTQAFVSELRAAGFDPREVLSFALGR
jgi:hypothetical protein